MRTILSARPLLVALVVVLLLAAPAVAADPHGEKKGGLDFTGLKRYDLGIYTIVVFCLLVFVVTKYAWPHIKTGLEKREQTIRGALEEARKDRDEARTALEQARKQLAEASMQAKGILDEARRDAEVVRDDLRAAGEKAAQSIKQNAQREIAAEKDALLKDVYEQAVKLAALMSEKALQRAVSAEDHRRLLDESIAELNQSANRA